MPVLVLAEHDNKQLSDATAKTLTAAVAICAEIHVLVAGANCGTVADEAAKLTGAAKILVADQRLRQSQYHIGDGSHIQWMSLNLKRPIS